MSTQLAANPNAAAPVTHPVFGAQNMAPAIMVGTSSGAHNIPAIAAGSSSGALNIPAITAGTPSGALQTRPGITAPATCGALRIRSNATISAFGAVLMPGTPNIAEVFTGTYLPW